MIIPGVDRFHYVGVVPNFNLSSFGAAPGFTSQISSKSNAEITQLPNGLTIITENKPGVFSGGINEFVNVGSVKENEKNSGATHFLEHMVFKRTKNRTGKQIAEEAGDVGAMINAGTSEDHTYYHTHVLGENIVAPTLIYLDMLLNNKMLQREFDVEKGVILEEAKRYEDDGQSRAFYLAQETYFKGHPYAKRVIGTQGTISGMQVSDLKKFLHDYYTADNMFISLAGDFDKDKAIKAIDEATSHITRKAKKEETPPLTYNVENAFDGMEIQQAHVVLLSRGYSLLDDKRYPLLVLNAAFGGSGLSSRLFRNIRNKYGYCYSIKSQPDFNSFGGAFMVYSGLKEDKVQEGVNLVLKEMKKVKQSGLRSDELERAKTQIRTGLVLKEESTDAASYSNGLSYMYRGLLIPIEEIDRKIRSVTNDEIIQVANEIFDPNYIAAYVVGPKSSLPKHVEISM